jgi:hypothetical protein
MALEHEYALLGGYNRSHVGRWLSVLAAGISSALVFLLLTVVDVASRLGIDAKLPPMALSLVGAGTVYAGLYLAFSHVVWRYGPLGRFLKVHDLSGRWVCEGRRLEVSPAQDWAGTLTIVQSWDRVRIILETETSISESLAAALQFDAVLGYRLMYHYTNRPRIEARNLRAHHGFAEITFSPDGKTASGEYFNGRGRNSFGSMNFKKEA